MSLLEEKYGKELVSESDDGVSITINLDGVTAVIDLETLVLHFHMVSFLSNINTGFEYLQIFQIKYLKCYYPILSISTIPDFGLSSTLVKNHSF